MKNSFSILLLSLIVSASVLQGCKNPDEPTETSLNLNFYPVAGSTAIAYNQEYIVNGRKLKFTRVQFYISDISLKKQDNTFVDPEMRYSLVHADAVAYNTGNIAVGIYTALDFSVGVDSAANHGDPTQWGTTHPLYVNGINSSYWDWSQGYVFMKLEGYVDTTAAANGTNLTGFAYHIGNDEMLRTVSLSMNKNISGDAAAIDLNIDCAKLLENINFRTELQTHTNGNDSIALKIADKVSEAISIK